LRFRNSFVPSISATYSKSASISDVASLMLLAVLMSIRRRLSLIDRSAYRIIPEAISSCMDY
jgi:hypothetical protein